MDTGYTWVYETRNGQRTGSSHGFPNRQQADEYVESMRWNRDNSPVYIEYKKQGWDWQIGQNEV